MKRLFVDASFWIALLEPHDALHASARSFMRSPETTQLITTEMVLVEVLNAFSGAGNYLRLAASRFVAKLYGQHHVMVIPQTTAQFTASLRLYQDRLDQGWSLTDCASFLLMQELHITSALTHDKHFSQAGFIALLREDFLER